MIFVLLTNNKIRLFVHEGDQHNLNGVVVSDDSQPVFTCGKEHLLIKFSKKQHSNPRLITSEYS